MPSRSDPLPPRRRLDVLFVGHTNVDVEIRVPHLPGGDTTVPVTWRRVHLGGTAANSARWASRMGLSVGLASFVGEDFADHRPVLLEAGVDTRDVRALRGAFTPTCWIVEDGRGGQQTLIDQGAMADTAREALPGNLPRTRWVHLATGDPAYQRRVAHAARALGVSVAFDPAQEIHYRWDARGLRSLLPDCEIFFGNEGEFGVLQRALRLREPRGVVDHVPLAVVTRGARGATAYSRAGVTHVPAAKVRHFHRVTGAGDAFRAGFYWGWIHGEPLERCLAWGTAAGATAVEVPPRPRGWPPRLPEVRRRLRA